ncbi:hypothetical protein JOM56_005291 [Amanita muscaria]
MFNFKRGVQRLLRFLAFSWGLVTTPMDQTQTYTGLMAVPSTGHALASFVPAFGTSTKTRRMDPSFPQRTARLPKGIPLRSKMRRMDSAGSESFRQRMARLSKGVVVRSLGTPTIAQASVSIEEYLKRLCLEDGALDGPLSDHDWSDNEKQAFYGPLSECEASDAEDGMPQSKVAPIEELFTLSHAFQQDVTRNPGGIPACYKDVTGIPGKFLVVNLAGNTAKNYQESTKTPEGCYQEFLVKCKDVRGNYQDSLYLD